MKLKKIMIHCSNAIEKVRRETIDGVEHIIISSFTLPDNIVMNGILYPAEEIEKSYHTLERTLAPVEHPKDADGNYLLASDPFAIHNYHAGAFNMNVTRENGRVHIEKHVNVQEALKTERGKRLLDRIDELETNENPRPIHSSTGVLFIPEPTDTVQTNDDGQEYSFIANDMIFDHDAILLNSIGAAQPSQGVGLAVNDEDEKIEVQTFAINQDIENDPVPGEGELSHEDVHNMLFELIRNPPINGDWIEQVFETEFIFSAGEKLFSSPYIIRDGAAKITGIPLPVDREVSFVPKTNNQKGDAMKELLINALKEAGIKTDDLDDAQLLAKYNELQANQSESDEDDKPGENPDALAEAITTALKPITDKIDSLDAKFNAKDESDIDEMSKIIGNSDKYPGLDADSAKLIGKDKLKEMVANCSTSHGLPFHQNESGGDDSLAPSDMPE